MKYFAIYNNDGDYTSLRTTDLWLEDTMPENSLELTKEQWQEAAINKCKVVEGVHTVIVDTQDEIDQKAFASLRSQRNKLLTASDWTQLQDAPLTSEQKQAWAAYRQSLRDLPATADINNIVYPETP